MVRSNEETMECPVCYSADACCHLVCGHSFCGGCTKEWWLKSAESNCPMCRAPLYFRGLRKMAERWEEEREEKMKEAVYTKIFNEIIEDLGEEFDELEATLTMFALREFDERFRKFAYECDWDFTEEELYEIVGDMFMDIYNEKCVWDESAPDNLLFVSKGKNGTERKIKYATSRDTPTPPMDLYTILIVV